MMGPRAALRARRHRQLLAEAIDRDYYRSQVAPPLPPGFDPVEHYLTDGGRLHIDPIRAFDSRNYARSYPDVAESGLPPFLHYLLHGRAEGRDPLGSYTGYEDLRPWFDPVWYLAENPDVGRDADVDPFEHFAYTGWREGRDPTAWFSLEAWREANPDAPADENPFALHLRGRLRMGWRLALGEPRWTAHAWDETFAAVEASGLIDERYYFTTYPELAGRGLSALEHYLTAGAAELRNPGPAFDTGWWATRRGVRPSEALAAFAIHGHGEGRPPMTATLRPGPLPASAACAVHLHLSRLELLETLIDALAHWPAETAVWVTAFTEADARWARRRLDAWRPGRGSVRVDPRRGLGPIPAAFIDLAGAVDAILCARLESLDTAARIDGLFAAPSAAPQIVETFAAHPTLAWLGPETDWRTRRPGPEAWAGRVEPCGWLRPSALAALAGEPSPPLERFEADAAPSLVEAALSADLTRRLEAAGLAAGQFVWPERQRLSINPPAPAAPRLSPSGRRWPREDPAIALRRPLPLNPRSRVYDPARLDIAWIMPDLLRGSGGHMSILRLVEQLAGFGHRQTIWIQNPRGPDPMAVKRRMQGWFRPIPEDVAVVNLPDDLRAVSADVVIATEAWSAFPAANVANAKARFYLIQDYEPLFHPAGDVAMLAEQTYGLGLDALTAGDWLLGKAEGHGMWARKWDLAVDHAAYFPIKDRPARDGAPRIAVYARRSTPRRSVGLAFAALTELHRRGVAFEAVLFGDQDPPKGLAFPHVHAGVVAPEALGEIYRACDIGLVFSATNYSLVPLEMMACGLPVVELDGDSTRAVFRGAEAVLAAPDAHAVADALAALAASPKGRAKQAARGRAFVSGLSWEASARQVETALLERLGASDARAIDAAAVCAPAVGRTRRVSVVIPTYNGSRLFDRVLAAAASQDCAFEYDVLVIDSGSTDRTAEVASKVGGRVWLHTIDKAQFQHGRTRNLGVELTDGDIVAFLTQDALPGDRHWLRRLVEGFDASPRTGLVFGRHRAYPAHGLFAARDLDAMFDRFQAMGPLISTRLGLPSSVYAGGEEWRRLMGFYSDNNSALLRAAWTALPYPEIDWGEDQVLGWEMVRQGFDKAYADQAVVFHSHQRKAGEQLQVAIEEGRLFKREFGVELVQPDEAAGLVAAICAQDSVWGAANGMGERALALRAESVRLSIEGRLRGAAQAAD